MFRSKIFTKKKFLELFLDKVLKKGYTSNNILLSRHYVKIIISGIITAIGLGLDNGPLIVGSLLLSPLIDPISNIILYFHIKRPISHLIKYLAYFSIDVILLLLIGYIFGYIFNQLFIKYKYNNNIIPEYPTNQMYIRTGIVPIITNTLVCFLAGILLLYTYIQNDVFYLIGIYICISFIIPIVNSGMLLYMGEHDSSKESFLIFLFGVIALIISAILIPFYSYMYI